MNTLNQIILLLFWLIFSNFTYAQNGKDQEKKPIVLIDPGHGGKDAGAIGINKIQEKDVVLQIANAILKLNSELDKPLDIYLTRYKDTLVSLSDRTKLAKSLKADLFVSLHCNHSANANARGVEVYASKKHGKYLKESIFTGYQIEKVLCTAIGYESRGVKFANFKVLRETVGQCASVLLELGFLSNKDEEGYISDGTNIEHIAFAILKSIEL